MYPLIFTMYTPDRSDRVACAPKHSADLARLERVDDALNTGVCPYREEEDANDNDEDVESLGEDVEGKVAVLANGQIGVTHAEVRHAPEDETEPAVEQGRHDRQHCEVLA